MFTVRVENAGRHHITCQRTVEILNAERLFWRGNTLRMKSSKDCVNPGREDSD